MVHNFGLFSVAVSAVAGADLGITFRASAALLGCALRCRLLSIMNLCLCFSFGVQTSGEYISAMFGCI